VSVCIIFRFVCLCYYVFPLPVLHDLGLNVKVPLSTNQPANLVTAAGKRRGRWGGGEFDTWGNLPKQCRIKTTRALAHRRN